MQNEIYAKLVTIERLLMILLSDKRYADLLADTRQDVYRDFGEPLNKLFPSDPEYEFYNEVLTNFNGAADLIKINQDYELLK